MTDIESNGDLIGRLPSVDVAVSPPEVLRQTESVPAGELDSRVPAMQDTIAAVAAGGRAS